MPNMPDRDMSSSVDTASPNSVETLLGKTLLDIGIPPCPAILNQINNEMRKEEPDFKKLESAISSDVALAAGLVALANSPFFSLRTHVRSVREALQMLGLAAVSRATAALIFRKMFPHAQALERFWDGSARIARLSGWLAGRQELALGVAADEAYTFGLFRDCGIPVLVTRFSQYVKALNEANVDERSEFTAIEDARCGINHAAVGGLLAQAWWLPDEVSSAIRLHHDYRLMKSEMDLPLCSASARLVAIAQVAEYLLQRHTGLSRTCEWGKWGTTCMALLRIDEQMLEALYEASAEVAEGNT